MTLQPSIAIVVLGDPRAKGRPRFDPRTGRARTPRGTRLAENTFGWEARKQLTSVQPLTGPVAVRVRFYTATARRVDVDNLVKLTLDALNGIAWEDDSQIVHVTATKTLDRENPRTELDAWPAGAIR